MNGYPSLYPRIALVAPRPDGHRGRSARVARIQRQNLSLTVELYPGDLKKTILAIIRPQLRMIYLTPMHENVKPQRSRATWVARMFIAHRKRESNGVRCVIRWLKNIYLYNCIVIWFDQAYTDARAWCFEICGSIYVKYCSKYTVLVQSAVTFWWLQKWRLLARRPWGRNAMYKPQEIVEHDTYLVIRVYWDHIYTS